MTLYESKRERKDSHEAKDLLRFLEEHPEDPDFSEIAKKNNVDYSFLPDLKLKDIMSRKEYETAFCWRGHPGKKIVNKK